MGTERGQRRVLGRLPFVADAIRQFLLELSVSGRAEIDDPDSGAGEGMTELFAQLRPELTSLMDCFATPAVLLRPDGTVITANQAYRRRFGDGKPLQGRSCDGIMAAAGYDCHTQGNICPLESCGQTGLEQHVLHVHDQGAVQIDLYPIRDDQGVPRYFLELLSPLLNKGEESSSMVGNSAAWREVLHLIRRAAPSDSAVLLLGESGTGKELAAAAIHRASPRSAGPFVVLDCSGLSETLFESELFGHEKGAFTGAHSRKIGLAEAANGGTLFLDEVGDIPLALQVKLLRLLETGQFRRVGGVDPIHSDFRLISATHRDLEKLVAEERFRRDLYYRINMFPIFLPALRERREDIDALAETLLHRLPEGRRLRLHPDTLACLRSYDYPGNIRELRNILGRAALLADEVWILPEHLPPYVRQGEIQATSSPLAQSAKGSDKVEILPLAELEAQYLRWARDNFPGDRRTLARRLGVSERTLYRKLDQLDERQSHAPQLA